MALVKDDWVIRSTSTIDIPTVKDYIRGQLDEKQELEDNLDSNGSYKDNYYADCFDSRDGSLYRIFSTGATENPAVIDGSVANGDGYYDVVYLQELVKTADLSNYRVEDEIVQIVDNKINQIQIDEVIIG